MAEHTKFTRVDVEFNDEGHAEGAVELHLEMDGEHCAILVDYEIRKQGLYQAVRLGIPMTEKWPSPEGNRLTASYALQTPSQSKLKEAFENMRFDYVFPCGAGYWNVPEVKHAKKLYGKERLCVFSTEGGGPDTPLFPDDVEEVKAVCFKKSDPHDNGCGGDGEGRECVRCDGDHYVVMCLAKKKLAEKR